MKLIQQLNGEQVIIQIVEIKKLIFEIIENNSTDLLELDAAGDLDNILETIIVDILKDDNNNDVDALLMKLNEKIYFYQ